MNGRGRRGARGAATVLALFAGSGSAAAEPAWPPPPEAQSRIAALRQTLGDPAATPAQRKEAREALAKWLLHPDARPGTKALPAAPRAAVSLPSPQPAQLSGRPAMPAVPATAGASPPSAPAGVIVDPRGGVILSSGASAVDPATGRTLLDAGHGWVDPATGRFVPKP